MNKIILQLQKILLIAVINLLIFNNSNADVINKIFINGNERVSDETVIMFSKIKIGDEVSQKSLNDAVKDVLSDKDNMKDYKFTKAETDNDIRRGSFVQSFLQSLRQKMNVNSGKKN